MNVTLEVNRRPGRLWQFLQFPLTRILIAALAVVAVVALIEIAARAMGLRSQSVPGLLVALLLMVATLVTYYVYVRVIERRAVVELGAPHALADVGAGFLVGGLLFGATMLALVCAGVGSVAWDGGFAALLYPLVAALVAAVSEELLIRGVFFRILEERLGSWVSLALTAALFGGLHAFNTGATVTSSVAIALEAGVLLAAVYMYSRRLWMPIGLHAGWNFTEGGIFGASVSGHDAHGMLVSRFRGPDLLTGGAFGPAVRRGHVVPPQWRRTRDASSAG